MFEFLGACPALTLSVLFLNRHSLCLEKTPHSCVCKPGLFVTRQLKRSLSNLKLFNLLFPVYFPSSLSLLLVLTPLCFNVRAQRRGGKLCFGKKQRGLGLSVLIFWPVVHVMSVKGIKMYHQTNLSVTPTTVLPPSLPPHPFHFSTVCYQRAEGATSHRSSETSNAWRPLIS